MELSEFTVFKLKKIAHLVLDNLSKNFFNTDVFMNWMIKKKDDIMQLTFKWHLMHIKTSGSDFKIFFMIAFKLSWLSSCYYYFFELVIFRLKLSYSVKCLGMLVGPKCNLLCNTSSQSSSVAICQSNVTGFYYQCSYGSNGQVSH